MTDKRYFPWGEAGGQGKLRRLQVEGDPTPYIPLWAAGSMVVNTPAHLMGSAGGAYFYGTTKVGGITNMISDGTVLRSLVVPGVATAAFTGFLGGTGAGGVNVVTDAKHLEGWGGGSALGGNPIAPVVNGEFFDFNPAAEFSAGRGAFTTGAITVTATNGSPNLTFTASVAALAFTFAYAYTPNFPNPKAGDVIAIVDGGLTHFYRFTNNPAGTATIFPNYTGTGGAGLAFTIFRTGYGSMSHVVGLQPPGGFSQFYFAGLQPPSADGFNGTIMCAQSVTNGVFMSPVLSPSGNPLKALDVAFYKGFLLYGFGGAIGWSVAGFPTVTAAPFFGSTDFPDLNVSVIDLNDTFHGFEFIGDQLVAFFSNDVWLVQATGTIPEFAFYRLPEQSAIRVGTAADTQLGGTVVSFTRPSTSTGQEALFASRFGLERIQGSAAATGISQPVDNYDFPAGNDSFIVKYDSASGTTLWGDTAGGRYLCMRNEQWFQLDLTNIAANVKVFCADSAAPPTQNSTPSYRPVAFGFYDPTQQKTFLVTDRIERESTTQSTVPWTWASPILNVGRIVKNWEFGGFEIWARAATGAAIPTTLTWTLYGGNDPYHMSVIQVPTLYDYASGFQVGGSRARLGGTFQYPFYGIVLSGFSWIELAGVMVYPSESQAAQ